MPELAEAQLSFCYKRIRAGLVFLPRKGSSHFSTGVNIADTFNQRWHLVQEKKNNFISVRYLPTAKQKHERLYYIKNIQEKHTHLNFSLIYRKRHLMIDQMLFMKQIKSIYSHLHVTIPYCKYSSKIEGLNINTPVRHLCCITY